MQKRKALQAGLIFGLLALVMGFAAIPLVGLFGSGGELFYLVAAGGLGLLCFGFLMASNFLPEGMRDRPTFTEEMMGREKLNYGGVYTEGNWKSVLDEKDKEDKGHR